MPRMPTWKVRSLEYLQAQEAMLVSIHTVDTKRVALGSAFRWAVRSDAPMDPKKWTGLTVRAYWDSIEHLSEATQLHYLTHLMQFLRWCGNPNLKDVRIRITPSRTNVDWLTEEQVAYVIATTTHPSLRAAIVLMACLGLRLEETTRIKRSDMHPDWVQVRGKGFKARKIPISKPVWDLLVPYISVRESMRTSPEDKDLFILSGRKRRYDPETLASCIYKMMHRYKFHFSAHTFRRTYGRLMYARKCPLVKLKTWMGHATLEMTIRYLGIEYQDPTDGGQYIPRYIK